MPSPRPAPAQSASPFPEAQALRPGSPSLCPTLRYRNRTVVLSPRETQLYRLLVIHQGKWLLAREIAVALWGLDSPAGDNSAYQLVHQLRRKLDRFVRSHPRRGLGWGVPDDAVIPTELPLPLR